MARLQNNFKSEPDFSVVNPSLAFSLHRGAIVLCAFFIGSMVTSTLVASKLTEVHGFTFSVGLLFFPVTFIVSEIGAEVYGAKFSRMLVLSGIAVQIAMLFALIAGDALPGSPVRDVSKSYHEMFALAPRMTFASIVAYFCSQWVDIESFVTVKAKTQGRFLWLRSIIAILISQAVDTAIFTLVFLGGVIGAQELASVFTVAYLVKIAVGILDTPLLYFGVYWVRRLDQNRGARQLDQNVDSKRLIAARVKTELFHPGQSLVSFIIKSVPAALIEEGMVLAITSKIVSLAEGAIQKRDARTKREVVEAHADQFLGETEAGVSLTVKHGILIPSAGIDESNSESGDYILFPKDPYLSAEKLQRELSAIWKLSRFGVVITDSHVTPLRLGVTGIALSHSGFKATRNYTGEKDLFGREMRMTQVNVLDSLASAAVFKMGEVAERCPLAVVLDDSVEFTNLVDAAQARKEISIDLKEDLYGEFFAKLPSELK
jgi:uncharacterized integral membrane protein (TIGR00697 family)